MPDKPHSSAIDGERTGVPEATLETSRLLVEFLHTAYATRNQDDADRHNAIPGAVSTHAVRAAIHVYQHGQRTVGQLASGLGISYGWASRVAEELESAGYLVRERDADDRRIVRVRLNHKALAEVERAYQWRGATVGEALEPLSVSERDAVRIFLRRLTDLLRAGSPGDPDPPNEP
jgi:DNA-binding MarR family transcriptional regulator